MFVVPDICCDRAGSGPVTEGEGVLVGSLLTEGCV